MAKVKTTCRVNTNLLLDALLHPLNRMLRGWTTYFNPPDCRDHRSA
ncbi:group II intron maturase-specific domain-containing protein [Plantactinospora sp. ZYX-F-223]